MKSRKSTIITIFVLIILTSCSHTLYQAASQSKPVTIDGIPNEWSLPLRLSDVNSKLQYNITNDADNLYVCIRATEPETQRKIIFAGMEIWLDPSGKNKRVTCIRFPLPAGNDLSQERSENNTPDQARDRDLKKRYFGSHQEMILSGFASSFNGTFPLDNGKGIKASINWDSIGIMTYELVIPFNSFYGRSLASLAISPVIGMQIVINAVNESAGGNRQHQGGGQHSSGGQMGENGGSSGHMGGMGGGGSRVGRGRMSGQGGGKGSIYPGNAMEENAIKFKIRLSK